MSLEFFPQKRVVIGALLAILALYTIFQARNLILGPELSFDSPMAGETVSGPVINITGHAKNVSFLTLNSRQIYVDDTGKWSESLLPSPGLVILELQGRDRFGREKKITEEIYVTQTANEQTISNTISTSTASTTDTIGTTTINH